ncbi:uncharacterized protein TRIADDRAFT_54357 [Trichoplax adhaerens]|uniref:dolichol kinase n=1 Tax=Trichoplax adhaerens TaxID=10228 RepID=B3RRT3_TRIAD|nr:hypothetical protein TRIADDRAFT_54357 [Trichoplax adhaerens]EDV26925.1 hypothetical protein TRIADDRAFT_54357 [Trichoplax adhaerens]|eukprot:XP_002110921.1 hypothetical protein TRIADDRAFT_54357 [Trichoplax adhaerens]
MLLEDAVTVLSISVLYYQYFDHTNVYYLDSRLQSITGLYYLMAFLTPISIILAPKAEYLQKRLKVFRPGSGSSLVLATSLGSNVLLSQYLLSKGVLQAWQYEIVAIMALLSFFVIAILAYITFMPKSFTIAEVVLISQGSSMFIFDVFISAMRMVYENEFFLNCIKSERHELTVVFQMLILWVVGIGVVLSPILMGLTSRSPASIMNNNYWSAAFYIGLTVFTFGLYLPVFTMLLRSNPIMWLLDFITLNSARIALICYWIFLVLIALYIVIWRNLYGSSSKIPAILIRKYFHVLVILIYFPGIYFDYRATYLASSVALALFLLAEFLRIFHIRPFGPWIHDHLQIFIDTRDSGIVILTHIYLLVGCALPLWLCQSTSVLNVTDNVALMYAGVMSLGIGDTFASLVGITIGKRRWPGNNRTLEGTAGSVLSMLLLYYLLWHIGGEKFIKFGGNWQTIILAFIITSLTEALTTQIDNLILPLVLYIHCTSKCLP